MPSPQSSLYPIDPRSLISAERLQAILDRFPELTIGLVGDLFLDRYLQIEPGVTEISIETGLEAYQVTSIRNSPGALGTVMNNLAALGVRKLVPVTVIGDDGHGYDLLESMRRLPADLSGVIRDRERLTPTYTKPMKRSIEGVWTELNRIDVRERQPFRRETQQSLESAIRDRFSSVTGWIVLDQIVESNWGVVNDSTRSTLANLSSSNPHQFVFVDSRAHLGKFDFGVLKGNQTEIARALGETSVECDLPKALAGLSQRTKQPAFCTEGERGIWVASGEAAELVGGFPAPPPIDVVGAGDSASAGLVMSLLSGATTQEAAVVANLVASITVRQLGTTGTATREQVMALYQS